MNISDKLLTEVESSHLAGVGIDTLNKYSEIGLLDTIIKENQKFYYENDVKTLFYAQLKVKTSQTPLNSSATISPQDLGACKAETPPAEEKNTATVENKTSNPEAGIQEKVATYTENEKTSIPAVTPAPDNFFPSSLELLEINKSLKEQIQILREERNWLRERIEKLETRSEREQMLLLSESENLRSMIKASKRTFWEKALPWFTKP